ncbi:hypothetical protein ABTZ59_32435 [Streptomyces sp. NPDC094034]|uniref:hypothetical protein n=1 Tax=Streptomyces sp. NPDC094034 TaxID=3155309 RepID=UPI003327E766
MHNVRQFLYQSGGIRFTPQQRSERHLTGSEREEMSRGIAAGESARDPYAHPEWAAGIWSSARAALLTQRHRADNTHAGALHVPPGTVVAFRTDALYLTQPHHWPYHGQPGDYLYKGHLPGPVLAPTSEDDLLALRDAGRDALQHTHTEGATP